MRPRAALILVISTTVGAGVRVGHGEQGHVMPFIQHPSKNIERLPITCQATMVGSEEAEVNQIDTVLVLLSNRKSDFRRQISIMKDVVKDV